MNDVTRYIHVFDRSARADRRQLALHRPSGGSDARSVFGTRIEYVAHPSFDDPDARDAILAPMPGPSADRAARRHRLPDGVRPEIACLYEAPLLSREQETHQFRKMNCLKHLAEQARSSLGPGRPHRRDLEEFERLRNEAAAVRQQIIRANLRLVTSIARKFAGRLERSRRADQRRQPGADPRGSTSSTSPGATSSAPTPPGRSGTSSGPLEGTALLRGRFVPACLAILQDHVDMRADPVEQQLAQDRRERIVAQLLRRLDDRERRILVGRFGIGGISREDSEPDQRGSGDFEGTCAPGPGAGTGPSPKACRQGRASPLAGLNPRARGHHNRATPLPRPPTSGAAARAKRPVSTVVHPY